MAYNVYFDCCKSRNNPGNECFCMENKELGLYAERLCEDNPFRKALGEEKDEATLWEADNMYEQYCKKVLREDIQKQAVEKGIPLDELVFH